ncbi:MAG TPA: hypothetical protein VMI53_08515, partial [Opitutaceae bacterium]|nr:hypothetical protein [Opitutaceae bacterium]
MDPSNQNPPRFTATALGCLERNGKKYYRGATAASSVNAAEAENAARALAQSRAEIAAGSGFFQKARASYPYPERILNEPLIDRVSLAGAATDAVAREIAKITRNSHGSTVLNAYEVMFVDVDTVQDLDNAAEGSVVEETAALAELHGLCSRQEEL